MRSEEKVTIRKEKKRRQTHKESLKFASQQYGLAEKELQGWIGTINGYKRKKI